MQGGLKHGDANYVFLRYLPWAQSSRAVVGTAQMVGLALLLCKSPGHSREATGWPISLALAVCLHHEAFGVNDGEPGQAILTVAMPKPPTFHIVVILACTKMCVRLSFLSFCSEAFLKPRPGNRLDSLNGQEPDREKHFCFWIGGGVMLWLHR